MDQKSQKIGFFGLAFKEKTDDIRESPIIKVILNLLQKGYLPLMKKGYDISFYDQNVTNQQFEFLLKNLKQYCF